MANKSTAGRSLTASVCGFILWMMAVATLADGQIRLAITTTTENSGLTAVLLPAFEARSGYQVHAIATGSGNALKLLANGDVDIALTHAPALETSLLAGGQARNHRVIMYNDFMLVGPIRDPAGAARDAEVTQALAAIASGEHIFVSRGDGSGTHVTEIKLWHLANIQPNGAWYRETGQGMGKTMQIASEIDGYTLVDRATWLARGDSGRLKIIVQGSEHLFNRYSVLSANAAVYPDVNATGAKTLTDWLVSAEAKQLIRSFTIHGQQLFVPLL